MSHDALGRTQTHASDNSDTGAEASAASPDLSSWPTVHQAASQLGVSARSIERRAEKGEIEIRYRQRIGRRPEPRCNPSDIERLKPSAHVMPAHTHTAALARSPEPERISSPPALDLLAAIAATLTAQQRNPPAADGGERWLSLEEAAAHTGLSEDFLRRAAIDKRIVAIKDKRKWKFKRSTLEIWDG